MLAPSVLVSILSDVRQAASAFHDSLAKISEKALSSEGTAHSLGKPKFKKRLCSQFITLKRFVLLTLSLLQSYLICLFMYSRNIDRPGGVYRKPWKLIEYCRSVTAVYRLASRAKTTIKCIYFKPL